MATLTNNRKHNLNNPNQGSHHKVLCVCSAGLLRSPTAAVVLSQHPYNFNTRAVGTSQSFALIPLDEAQLLWADEIIAVDIDSFTELNLFVNNSVNISDEEAHDIDSRMICLSIPDSFEYRDPELMRIIAEQYEEHSLYWEA